MGELAKNPQEFNQFLIQLAKNRLSGTSVMSVESLAAIRSSVLFVLRYGDGDTVDEQFQAGKETLQKKVAHARALYEALTTTYDSFGIDALAGTVESLGNFFDSYDLAYAANQLGNVWIDYQLAEPVDECRYQGVLFMEQYLQHLLTEAQFLSKIPKVLIHELLQVYQRRLGFDYRKDVNNLYEIVFHQFVVKLAVGSDPSWTLLLSPQESDYFYQGVHSSLKLSPMLGKILKNPYYRASFHRLKIKIAAIRESIDMKNYLCITEIEQKQEVHLLPPIAATEYNRMMETYAHVSHKKRLQLIKDTITSPYDLLELLENSLESEGFYDELFQKISDSLFQGLVLLIFQEQPNIQKVEELDEKTGYISALKKQPKARLLQVNQILTTYCLPEKDFS